MSQLIAAAARAWRQSKTRADREMKLRKRESGDAQRTLVVMLQFSTTLEAQRVVWRCAGFAETSTVERLAKELDSLHAQALRTTAREVLADVRELEFATSACLKEIVTWLRRVLELEEARRYRVRFRSHPEFGWQRRSLGALAVFARDVVTVESEGQR